MSGDSKTLPTKLFTAVIYRLRRLLTGVLGILRSWLEPWASRFPVIASLYYGTICGEFRREHHAFLAGRVKYEELKDSPTDGFSLLRRNIHRLEKGLLMRPRRDVFAREYIHETVECYEKSVSRLSTDNAGSELIWARDVLRKYFAVTASDAILDGAREIFARVPNLQSSDAECVPYTRDTKDLPAISIAQFEQLAKYRRSVRWFLDKPVERSQLDRAIAVAAQSPSACNRQPFQFRIFDDPELVKKVASVPMGTAGYRDNIPVMIVIVGQQRNYFAERDRHLIYIDASLAAMSFVFAAEVQGLSTCCINWPDIEVKEQELAAMIGLESDERPVMCLAIGHPDPKGMVAYSQKKQLESLRTYN